MVDPLSVNRYSNIFTRQFESAIASLLYNDLRQCHKKCVGDDVIHLEGKKS